MTTENQAPIEVPEIYIDVACLILTQASVGNLTLDEEFKAACRLAVEALRESALFWPKQDKE